MKIIPKDEVDIWFKVNNLLSEKSDLFLDFSLSLKEKIELTYLGYNIGYHNITNIILDYDDKINHFDWCWNSVLNDFSNEGILFNPNGDHYDYFRSFFLEVFYNESSKLKNTIDYFFVDIFDRDSPYSKYDLDIYTEIYKMLDKNMTNLDLH